jgi:hypothetical protein
MPQIIDVPNHGQIEFPDGMSDDQIVSAIRGLDNNLANTQASTAKNKSVVAPAIEPTVQQKLAKAKQGLADVDNMEFYKPSKQYNRADLIPDKSIGEMMGISDETNKYLNKIPIVGGGAALLKINPKKTVQQLSSGLGGGAVQIGAELAGNQGMSDAIAKNTSEAGFGIGNIPEMLMGGGGASKLVGKAGDWLGKGLTGAATGAAYGGASAVGEGGDRGEQALVGGLVGGVAGPVIQGATKASQFLVDAVRGRTGQVSAGKLGRAVAGDKLDDIMRLNAQAPKTVTSSQAAVGADRSVYNALGELARSKDPDDIYSGIVSAQAKNRVNALQAVKPNLKQSEDVRKAVSDPLYTAVRDNKAPVNINPIIKKVDKLLDENSGNTAFVNALNDVKKGLVDSDGNPVTKAVKISSVMDGLKKALGDKDNKYIRGELTKIREDIAKVLPNRVEADKVFAEASKPVNQAKVIDALVDKMQSSTGGEVQRPFLNALGTGENALLKKANQDPRFGGIDEALTGEQVAVKNRIESEYLRDFEVQKRAKDSLTAFADIVKDNKSNFKFPNFFSAKVTTANAALDILENKIDKKTMKALVNGMRSGQNANEMLNALPSGARNKVVKALTEQRALPYGFGAVTSMQQGEK